MAEDWRGYLLAGGASSRFGRDKARAAWAGRTLPEHNAELMAEAGMSVTVVAQRPDAYDDLGLRVIGDVLPEKGPLGGIYTALRDARDAEWAMVVACDIVGIKKNWIERLWRGRPDDATVVLFAADREQPLFGLYATRLIPALERILHAGELGVMRFLEQQRVVRLSQPEGWEALGNLNTQAQWRRARGGAE